MIKVVRPKQFYSVISQGIYWQENIISPTKMVSIFRNLPAIDCGKVVAGG